MNERQYGPFSHQKRKKTVFLFFFCFHQNNMTNNLASCRFFIPIKTSQMNDFSFGRFSSEQEQKKKIISFSAIAVVFVVFITLFFSFQYCYVVCFFFFACVRFLFLFFHMSESEIVHAKLLSFSCFVKYFFAFFAFCFFWGLRQLFKGEMSAKLFREQ